MDVALVRVDYAHFKNILTERRELDQSVQNYIFGHATRYSSALAHSRFVYFFLAYILRVFINLLERRDHLRRNILGQATGFPLALA